jgi:hypothetical protein
VLSFEKQHACVGAVLGCWISKTLQTKWDFVAIQKDGQVLDQSDGDLARCMEIDPHTRRLKFAGQVLTSRKVKALVARRLALHGQVNVTANCAPAHGAVSPNEFARSNGARAKPFLNVHLPLPAGFVDTPAKSQSLRL